MNASGTRQEAEKLISNPKEIYGEHFEEHLLEQYKLYVDSAQKVSEKRITTGNYLLTVSSSLLTAFGIVAMLHAAGPWLVIIPISGLVVAYAWFSLVVAYKDLNAAKFKVIHELEDYLPAAIFRYEWHCCQLGKGKAYRPVTRHEKWIPVIFAVVYIVLMGCILFPQLRTVKRGSEGAALTGTSDLNRRSRAKLLDREHNRPSVPARGERRGAGNN